MSDKHLVKCEQDLHDDEDNDIPLHPEGVLIVEEFQLGFSCCGDKAQFLLK
nr:hypothetical protein [Limisalsivibrio acetivorans]